MPTNLSRILLYDVLFKIEDLIINKNGLFPLERLRIIIVIKFSGDPYIGVPKLVLKICKNVNQKPLK